MSQVTQNAVSLQILAIDAGTDTARIRKCIDRSGQVMIDTLGALLTPDAVKQCNQKALVRLVQGVSFAVSGASEDFNKTTAHVIACVMLTAQQRVEFADMRYLCGQSNMVQPGSVQGVSRARFQRFIGRAGTAKTIESQVSRSVGVRGFLTALGVTVKSDAHGFTLTPAARTSAFVLGYAHQLQTMTEGQFQLVTE